jgi:hypothetical protein
VEIEYDIVAAAHRQYLGGALRLIVVARTVARKTPIEILLDESHIRRNRLHIKQSCVDISYRLRLQESRQLNTKCFVTVHTAEN